MPQGALPVRAAANISTTSVLNVTATTVVKASPGTCYRASIVTYGTAAPALYDVAVAANAAASNEICTLGTTATQGTIAIEWPFFSGLVVNPNGGTICIAYS